MFAGPIFVSASKVHAFNNAVHSYEIKQLLRTKTKKNVNRHAEALSPHPLRHVKLLQSTPSVTLRACPPPIPSHDGLSGRSLN